MVLAYEAYVIHYASSSLCNLAFLSLWVSGSRSSAWEENQQNMSHLHDGFCQVFSKPGLLYLADFKSSVLSIWIYCWRDIVRLSVL